MQNDNNETDKLISSASKKTLLFSRHAGADEKDFLLPFDRLMVLAEKQDPSAQFLVASSLLWGRLDTVINIDEGRRWMALAAKHESSPAGLCAKGYCTQFAQGGVLIKNPEKAKQLYITAIEQGYIPAMPLLANVLLSEAITTTKSSSTVNATVTHAHKDEEKLSRVVNLLATAAEAKYAPALVALADCYDDGNGVKTDKKEAFKLYKLAAEAGSAYAKRSLGACYEFDNNITEARHWYKAAQAQGYDVSRDLSRTAVSGCCKIM